MTTQDSASVTAATDLPCFSDVRGALGFSREIAPPSIAAFNAGAELIQLAIRLGVYVVGNLEGPGSGAPQWDRTDWGKAQWSSATLDRLRQAARMFLIRAADLGDAGDLVSAATAANQAGRYFAEMLAHEPVTGRGAI